MEPAPNMITYNTVINGLWRSRKDTEAQTLLDEMISVGVHSVSDLQLHYCKSLLVSRDREGNGRLSLHEEEEMQGGRGNFRNAFTQSGDLERALDHLHQRPFGRDLVSRTLLLQAFPRNQEGDAQSVKGAFWKKPGQCLGL
ncbi:hypothetical protein SELMODRAFT_418647 [Selaginella moellendorffii]|uniref:Pentacotripeptide-repeat region of PRORP domain-containing protein n=1 Tax=Selaginella moellendorffii TaxID=88036 RepID=D8S6P9_SELML|nr:hypothetical protein SELMODRAFT_418647 [Selaginella moellendorffii]